MTMYDRRPMPKFQKHIFICTNQRPEEHPRGCCNPSGSGELHRLFKEKLSQRGIPGTAVRANKSGCLEQCEHGPTVVIYPEAVWYGGVTPEDVDEIVSEHLVHGRPVERLMLAEECINTASCPHRPAVPVK